jgi:serine/threonine protein kinase
MLKNNMEKIREIEILGKPYISKSVTRNEYSIHSLLNEHVGGIHVVKLFHTTTEFELIMDKMDGPILNIFDYLYDNYEELFNLTKQVLLALEYLHKLNITHGDISSDNILYEVDINGVYNYVLCDFGLSAFNSDKNRQHLDVRDFITIIIDMFEIELEDAADESEVKDVVANIQILDNWSIQKKSFFKFIKEVVLNDLSSTQSIDLFNKINK